MKKHMVLSTNKHPTKLGKALHGISWMMLMMWIMVGAILLVSEFSFRSILLWNTDFDLLKRQVLKQHLRPCFFIGKAHTRPLALPGLTVVC